MNNEHDSLAKAAGDNLKRVFEGTNVNPSACRVRRVENGWIVSQNDDAFRDMSSKEYVFTDPQKLGAFFAGFRMETPQ